MKDPAAKVDSLAGLSEEEIVLPGGAVDAFAPRIASADTVANQTQQFRSQVGHISRQSGVFFLGTIFTAVFGYAFKIYLARVLGADSLGIYALGMTVVGLVGIAGGLGLTWSASKFPAVYGSTGRIGDLRSFLLWSVFILVSVNGLLALGMVFAGRWVATRLYHTPALADYLNLFALIMFLGALTAFFAQLLTGYKEVAKRALISNFAAALFTMFFTVILVERGAGLRGYILAQVLSAGVVLILLVWACYRLTPSGAWFSLGSIPSPPVEMFSFASAAFTMDVMGFLYSQTDKIILGFYLDARSVGIYAMAATIVAFLPIMLQSVNQIFSPTIADLHARGEMAMINRLFQALTKWTLSLTVPLAAVVIIFSRVMMRIFGHDFEAGWVVLVIGAVGQLVNCAVGSVGYLLLMSGHEKKLVKIQLVMALVTVSSCLLLVPGWGVAGAAIAAALGNAGSNAWCLWEVRKTMGLFPYNRGYWRLVLPTAATVATVIGLREALQSIREDILIVVLTTAIAYAVFLVALLLAGLEADDRLIAGIVWNRVRGSLLGSRTGSRAGVA